MAAAATRLRRWRLAAAAAAAAAEIQELQQQIAAAAALIEELQAANAELERDAWDREADIEGLQLKWTTCKQVAMQQPQMVMQQPQMQQPHDRAASDGDAAAPDGELRVDGEPQMVMQQPQMVMQSLTQRLRQHRGGFDAAAPDGELCRLRMVNFVFEDVAGCALRIEDIAADAAHLSFECPTPVAYVIDQF